MRRGESEDIRSLCQSGGLFLRSCPHLCPVLACEHLGLKCSTRIFVPMRLLFGERVSVCDALLHLHGSK